jgi:hypothetical protein
LELALDFKMSPRQLLQSLSGYELGEFIALYRLRNKEQQQAESEAARRIASKKWQ